MSLRRPAKPPIDYKKFTPLVNYPISHAASKSIFKWIEKYAKYPDFDLNQLKFTLKAKTEAERDIRDFLVMDDSAKGEHLFLPFLGALATTEIEKNLFLNLLNIIPVEKLRQLIDPTNYKLAGGLTFMHFVVFNNKFSKEFITKCHQLDIPFLLPHADGQMPVHFIARRGNIEALKVFLELKVSVDSVDKYGCTAGDIAYIQDSPEIFAIFKEKNAYDYSKIYYYFIISNRLEDMKKLEKEAKINFDLKNPETILINSIKYKNIPIIEYLLNKPEVDVNVFYKDRTALSYAIAVDLPYIVNLILQRENVHISIDDLFDAYRVENVVNCYKIVHQLVNKLKEEKNTEILNSYDDRIGGTLLHYAVMQGKQAKTFIDMLVETNLVDVNKKQMKAPFLTPLEYAVSLNVLSAFEVLSELKNIEKNTDILFNFAMQHDDTEILERMIIKRWVDLPTVFHELMKPIHLSNKHKLSTLKKLLPTLSETFYSEHLSESIKLAITHKAWIAVLILSTIITSQTISAAQSKMLREVIAKLSSKDATNVKNVVRILDQYYPVATTAVTMTRLADYNKMPDKKDEEEKREVFRLKDLQNATSGYEAQLSSLVSRLDELKLYPGTETLTTTTEEKLCAVVSLIASSDAKNIDNHRDRLLESTIKLNSYQQTLEKQARKILRQKPIAFKIEQKSSDMEENKKIIVEKKREPKPQKQVKLPTAKKPKKKKSVAPLSPEQIKAIENRNANVKFTVEHFQAFVKKMGLPETVDEKNLFTVLQKKCVSLRDKLAVKYFLESVLIEFALNKPIGLGKLAAKDFRTANLYKSFNEENLKFREWKEPLDDEKNTVLMTSISQLFFAAREYVNNFNVNTNKLRDFTPTSFLLVQLSESSKDTRYVFTQTLFVEGIKKAHAEFQQNYAILASSDMISGCELLTKEQKVFTEAYFHLRQISEAQKAEISITGQERTLANQWRHPGEKTRQEITRDILILNTPVYQSLELS